MSVHRHTFTGKTMNFDFNQKHISLPVLKGAFPFRLGTTSYILPAPILPNIRLLGPYLDEVELILFESSREENLPSEKEIQEMIRLGGEMDLSFNVHLPIDLYLGDPDPDVRKRGCSAAMRFYKRTLPLNPTVYVLHLDWKLHRGEGCSDHKAWLGRLENSLENLVTGGIDPGLIAVENLDYPLEWVRPIVEAIGMQFCLDIGHLMLYGHDLKEHFRIFLEKTAMMHIHGIQDAKDHRGLHAMSDWIWEAVVHVLKNYDKGVSIEVFSLEDLDPSLRRMEELV